LIKINTVGNSEEQAKLLVQLTTNNIIESHQPKFKSKREIFKDKYQTLTKEIEFLQEQVKKTGPQKGDSISIMLTTVERSRQWERLGKLQKDISNYAADLKPDLVRETKLVEKPASMIISKRRKITLFGFFSGFLVSLILAYLFEFRRQRQEGLTGTA